MSKSFRICAVMMFLVFCVMLIFSACDSKTQTETKSSEIVSSSLPSPSVSETEVIVDAPTEVKSVAATTAISSEDKNEMVGLLVKETPLSEESAESAVDSYCLSANAKIETVNKVDDNAEKSLIMNCTADDNMEYTFSFSRFGSSYDLRSIYCETKGEYVFGIIE